MTTMAMDAAIGTSPTDTEFRILALYRFVPLIPLPLLECWNGSGSDGGGGGDDDDEQPPAPAIIPPERHPTLLALQSELATTLRKHHVKGTILLAPEGINGTICYPVRRSRLSCGSGTDSHVVDNDTTKDTYDPVANYLKTHPLFGGPDLRTRLSVWKENDDDDKDKHDNDGQKLPMPTPLNQPPPKQAFHRLKIKIKAEIVTLGLGRNVTDDDEVEIRNLSKSNGIANTTATSLSESSLPTSYIHRYKSNHQLSNPLTVKGQYLSPDQWDNIAIRNPNILVIDTRNTYEIDIGTFETAIDPHTKNFSDLPQYLERLAEEYDWSTYSSDGNGCVGSGIREEKDMDDRNSAVDNTWIARPSSASISSSSMTTTKTTAMPKKPPPEGIAMFCTGGIRCEKATSYAIQSNLFPKGLPIYHLAGGILAYLDHVATRTDEGVGGEKSKENETEGEEECEPSTGASEGNVDCATTNSKMNCKNQKPSSSHMKSTFHGECFVFDKRVAVTEGLRPSKTYISCHGCRGPMDYRLMLQPPHAGDRNSTDDEAVVSGPEAAKYQALAAGIPDLPPLRYDIKTRRHYLPGLTCPRCHASTTRESLERFAERNRQVEICNREGRAHFQDLGGDGQK
jgi:predicted sulfurtransferase